MSLCTARKRMDKTIPAKVDQLQINILNHNEIQVLSRVCSPNEIDKQSENRDICIINTNYPSD